MNIKRTRRYLWLVALLTVGAVSCRAESGRRIQPSDATATSPPGVSPTITPKSKVVDEDEPSANGATGSVPTQSEETFACPDSWFFENPPSLCPDSAATESNAAAQHFEQGIMVWVEAFKAIFVLYDDSNLPRWVRLEDHWELGLPESDAAIVPPADLFQPIRGFGMTWREADGVVYHHRERLGWAIEPEFGIAVAFQCDSQPTASTCYLLGPDGVITLRPEGSDWYIWNGP